MTITVYQKSNCQQCKATTRQLEIRNLDYLPIDLEADPEAYNYVTGDLGHQQAPVVVVRDDNQVKEHWSGFRPDRIKAYALA